MTAALQLNNGFDELTDAVWSVQTNYILKRLAINLRTQNKYDIRLSQFVRLLKVDIENCTPIYFNGMTYKKKEHGDNFFLFLDNNFKLMAILQGNERDEKEFSKLEFWDWERGYGRHEVKKNRKNLTEKATHILMITPEMRTWGKYKPKPQPRFVSRKDAKDDLNDRLRKYKKKKHEEITIEECKEILTKALLYFTTKMFEPKEEQRKIAQHFKQPIWFANNVPDLIRGVQDIVNDLNNRLEEIERAGGYKSDYHLKYVSDHLKKVKVDIGALRNKLNGVK